MKTRNEKGAVFVLTMIMLVLCSGLLTASYLTAIGDTKRSAIEEKRTFALSYAESGVEFASKGLRTFAANFMTPMPTGVVVINGVDVNWSIQKAIDADGHEILLNTIAGDDFHTISKLYIIEANCFYEGRFARVSQFISLDALPIFQFFAFYNKDLEFFPGPAMYVDGRMHSNEDIYIAANSSITFRSGRIRTAGDIWRYRKDRPNTWPSGRMKLPNGGSFDKQYDSDWEGYYGGEYMDFAQMAIEQWGGFIMTGEHGVSQIDTPKVGTIEPYVPNSFGNGDYTYDSSTGTYTSTPGVGDSDLGYYHGQAGLVVTDGNVFLDGVDITASLPAHTVESKRFYDGREDKYVYTTDIDVDKLYNTMVTVNGVSRHAWPSNGLIYANRSDASASQPNGIRIKNAKKLPTKVTWVSPNPVYLWGDYNKISEGKVGSSIICDAINFLSNNWNDSKRKGQLPRPNTTGEYNLGIIAGGTQTSVGKYNGGLENYPRFHEKWSGKDVRMKASFVSLWDSKIGKGRWRYGGDNYAAPRRKWFFDTDFLDPDKLPPYTPNAYMIRPIAWWKGDRLPW